MSNLAGEGGYLALEVVREGEKFMGYPGRVLKQGGKDFFSEKI